jgi:hypothetical protein
VSEQLEVLVAGEAFVDDGLLGAVAQPSEVLHGAGVGGELTDEDLHEGGLARPVLPD